MVMKSVQLLYTTNMSHDITLSVIQSSLWIMIGQLKFNWFVWGILGNFGQFWVNLKFSILIKKIDSYKKKNF